MEQKKYQTFNIDVSNLSPEAAEALTNELKESIKARLEQAHWMEEWKKKERVEEKVRLETEREQKKESVESTLGDAARTEDHGKGTLEGLLIFYINVGALPPFKAEAFVERLKERFKPTLQRLPDSIGTLFVPVRTDDTRIELCQWNVKPTEVEYHEERRRRLEDLKMQIMAQNPSLLVSPNQNHG